ncbi:MAG: hypothetical protein Q4D06_03435 [Coriobacteriia bacterium]|nr:hypothetical protein [Coriobacteriia bacterium]
MRKKIGLELTRGVKKQMDRLRAADTFGDFLSLGLGHPEQLSGYDRIRYSIRVSANARLIVEPNATTDTLSICSELEIEGVSDYHGGKDNWYIP